MFRWHRHFFLFHAGVIHFFYGAIRAEVFFHTSAYGTGLSRTDPGDIGESLSCVTIDPLQVFMYPVLQGGNCATLHDNLDVLSWNQTLPIVIAQYDVYKPCQTASRTPFNFSVKGVAPRGLSEIYLISNRAFLTISMRDTLRTFFTAGILKK